MHIWKYKPLKYLSFGKKRISGRNNTGKIVNYHRGGGSKKKMRLIDFKRYLWNIYGLVIRLEYDPNRNSFLALVGYANGIMSYIIAPNGLRIGDRVISRENALLSPGNSTLLSYIPIGVRLNCLEFYSGEGAKIARSAGVYAVIIKKDISKNFSIIKLSSGEIRKFNNNCIATLGYISNFNFIFKKFLKAGYYRNKGWRPVVRGVAMNPIDHPHGGGQGKTSGGRPSVNRYGFITKGKPTKLKKEKNINVLTKKSLKKKK